MELLRCAAVGEADVVAHRAPAEKLLGKGMLPLADFQRPGGRNQYPSTSGACDEQKK